MITRVRIALALSLSLAASGCGADGGTGSQDNEPQATRSTTPTTAFFQSLAVTPMSARQFHAVGVAVGAQPLRPNQTSASALGQSDDTVIAYMDAVCRGERPLIRVSVFLYPRHVPAFETIFSALPSRCPRVTEQTIAYERGAVAKTMASQQLSTARLLNPGATSGFCGQLQQNEKITSKAIGSALEGLHIVPEGAGDLVEVGVSLMIGYCPQLTGQLGN